MNTEPSIIELPLSTYENMTMEMNWRFQDLVYQIWDILDDLRDFKREYLDRFQQYSASLDNPHRPLTPTPFDPLRTIGKY